MINGPIILGLSGQAGTGKTSVAEGIVPKGSLQLEKNDFVWDHIFFALPLYEMASIRLNVKGLKEKERQLYGIHDVVYDLFGGSPISDVPDYDELVDLVHQIHVLPIESEGKPRSFLQKAGDLCRALDPDCFAKWGIAKSKKLHNNYIRSLEEDVEPAPFVVIISDVRFHNEAIHIKDVNNSILINFTASDPVRFDRLYGRDGYLMSEEQRQHVSENEMPLVQKLSDIIIDTDDMSVETQTLNTINYVKGVLYNYA